jgi:hypothetical protein
MWSPFREPNEGLSFAFTCLQNAPSLTQICEWFQNEFRETPCRVNKRKKLGRKETRQKRMDETREKLRTEKVRWG